MRLALEFAGARYADVARRRGGMAAMQRLLARPRARGLPFAPPFLDDGREVIAQTANILDYLGARHGLAPREAAGRRWALQLQLTLADWLVEAHDTHHPIGVGLYYEEQRREARRRAADYLAHRLPKYLDYFERVLAAGSGPYLLGPRPAYPDLSLFQMVAGHRYAFPRAMAALDRRYPRVRRVASAIGVHPRLAAYLASPRRLPFNEQGIFRHYPELDRIRNKARKT